MIKNFDVPLKNIDGSEIKENDKPVHASQIIANALLAPDNASGQEKAERYALSLEIYKGGDVDITVDNLAKIKELVGKAYAPLIVGQIYSIIDA